MFFNSLPTVLYNKQNRSNIKFPTKMQKQCHCDKLNVMCTKHTVTRVKFPGLERDGKLAV